MASSNPLQNLSLGKNTTPILVVLLIVAAFLIGSLWTKVSLLEKGGTSPTLGTNEAAPTPAPADTPTVDAPKDGEHQRGNKNGELALVEYVDLECPFCQQFHPTMKQVLDTYGNRINWVYRHYPLTAIHPNAQKAGEGAECVAELLGEDGFWNFVDAVFEDPSKLTNLESVASQVGADQQAFKKCLDSGKYAQKVGENLNKVSIGTPATFVFNKDGKQVSFISGAKPFADLKIELDNLLK